LFCFFCFISRFFPFPSSICQALSSKIIIFNLKLYIYIYQYIKKNYYFFIFLFYFIFFIVVAFFSRSFEVFIDAVREINAGQAQVADFDMSLASLASTFRTTAILQAGRMSLDSSGKAVRILYCDEKVEEKEKEPFSAKELCEPIGMAVEG
jgi:hypothetical protein